MSDGFDIEIDPASQLVRIAWPPVTPTMELWRAGFDRVMSDPRFRPHFNVLSDRRRLVRAPTPQFVRDLIATLATFAGEGRFTGCWAVVAAPGETAVYGMARMGEILSEYPGVKLRAFNELAPAEAWLTAERGDKAE